MLVLMSWMLKACDVRKKLYEYDAGASRGFPRYDSEFMCYAYLRLVVYVRSTPTHIRARTCTARYCSAFPHSARNTAKYVASHGARSSCAYKFVLRNLRHCCGDILHGFDTCARFKHDGRVRLDTICNCIYRACYRRAQQHTLCKKEGVSSESTFTLIRSNG